MFLACIPALLCCLELEDGRENAKSQMKKSHQQQQHEAGLSTFTLQIESIPQSLRTGSSKTTVMDREEYISQAGIEKNIYPKQIKRRRRSSDSRYAFYKITVQCKNMYDVI